MKFNKNFNIKIDYDYQVESDMEEGACYGIITIGEFYEYFYMSPGDWKISDYEKQWKLAFEHFKKNNQTCFIVNVQLSSPLIEMWNLYRINTTIHFQNHLIFDSFFEEFIGSQQVTPETSFNFIKPRRRFTEDGEKIAEWSLQTEVARYTNSKKS